MQNPKALVNVTLNNEQVAFLFNVLNNINEVSGAVSYIQRMWHKTCAAGEGESIDEYGRMFRGTIDALINTSDVVEQSEDDFLAQEDGVFESGIERSIDECPDLAYDQELYDEITCDDELELIFT